MENKIVANQEDSIPYVEQLAIIYKNLKTRSLDTDEKIQLYINFNFKKITAVFNLIEGRMVRNLNYILLDNRIFKVLFKYEQTKDSKILRTAAKTRLFLPYMDKIEIRSVLSCFPIMTEEKPIMLHPQKIKVLNIMLNEVQGCTRSEEGKDGVFFFSCKPQEYDHYFPEGRFIVKFVSKEEGERIIIADHFLKEMSFITPKAKCLKGNSNTSEQIKKEILKRINSFKKDNQIQIKNQLDPMNTILIMNHVPGITLSKINKFALLELLKKEEFLIKIGEMIFFDAFIGNIDRLSDISCNSGNIMIDTSHSSITLIDQKFCLDSISTSNILFSKKITFMRELLSGEKTVEMLKRLQTALVIDRKETGKVELESKIMKPFIDQGIQQGAKKLKNILSQEGKIRFLFQFPFNIEKSEIACRLIKELEKHIK